MTWFTADTHFGHTNVLRFDNAPFSNIRDRDEAILARHNAVVGVNDDVWHLGDVAWSEWKLHWYLDNAKGRIHLIRGNHDDRIAWPSDRFASKDEAKYIKVDGVPIYLSHYGCRVWRNSHHGSFHLYGHSHGNLPPLGRSMDVGVACNDYRPLSLDDILSLLEQEPVISHHT